MFTFPVGILPVTCLPIDMTRPKAIEYATTLKQKRGIFIRQEYFV